MSSPLRALLARSLREDARRPLTYSLRAGVVAVLAVQFLAALNTRGWTGAPGLDIFRTIVWVQLLAITLAGLTSFASTITEEKEDGALELLSLTELGNFAILVGKTLSRFLSALLLLLALVPPALLAVTLGGIGRGQILASEIVLLSFAFLVCNLAVLCSVIAPRTGVAVFLTACALGGIVLAAWIGGMASSAMGWTAGQMVAEHLQAALPWHRLLLIFQTGATPEIVGGPLWINLGTGAVCFLLALVLFDPSRATERGPASKVRRHCGGPSPHGRVWLDALAWKEHYFVHGGHRARWGKLGLLLAGLLAFGAAFVADDLTRVSFLYWTQAAAAVTALALVVDLALAGARAFRSEIDGRTLGLLAMTPLEPGYLIRCKLTCATASAWPIGLALALIIGLISVNTISQVWNSARTTAGVLGPIVVFFTSSLFVFGYLLPQALLLPKTSAWLSLRLRFGAPLLAIGLVGFLNGLCVSLGLVTFGAGFIGLPGAAIFVGIELRQSLVDSLDQLLAEE